MIPRQHIVREIGEILDISPRRFNKHLEQVFVKLDGEPRLRRRPRRTGVGAVVRRELLPGCLQQAHLFCRGGTLIQLRDLPLEFPDLRQLPPQLAEHF